MPKLRTITPPGFIASDADIRRGVRALRRQCLHMRRIHDATGDPVLRRREPGFEGLARIVVGQQLSIASADAIWRRTAALVQPFEAGAFLDLDDASLRTAGLSAGKIRTLRAAAAAVVRDGLDLDGLAHAGEQEIHDALTAISGIGPWTADIYIMFCLGRADGWASGDLALQIACQMAMELEARPSARELASIAERWRPWRGVAALLLWSYYKVAKDARSGAPA